MRGTGVVVDERTGRLLGGGGMRGVCERGDGGGGNLKAMDNELVVVVGFDIMA
jgi:hypothetical protein